MVKIFVKTPFMTEYKGKRVFFSPSTLMFEVEKDFAELDIVKRCCKIIEDETKKEIENKDIEVTKNDDYNYENDYNLKSEVESSFNDDVKKGRKKKIVE